MKRSVVVAGILALGVTAALAQQADVVAERQKLMKENADHSRAIGAMLKDQAPFDLSKVQSALKTFAHTGKEAHVLFPDHSKDGKSKAMPTVWEKKGEFEALLSKFEQDSQAALVAVKDEASFKAEMPKVLQNCGTCHKTFRQPVG